MKKNLLFLVLWGLLILCLSSIPKEEGKGLKHGADKLLHFGMYAYFGYLCSGTYSIAGAIGGSLFGITDELHQYFIPGRDVNFLDLISNLVGVWMGFFIFKFKRKNEISEGQRN